MSFVKFTLISLKSCRGGRDMWYPGRGPVVKNRGDVSAGAVDGFMRAENHIGVNVGNGPTEAP